MIRTSPCFCLAGICIYCLNETPSHLLHTLTFSALSLFVLFLFFSFNPLIMASCFCVASQKETSLLLSVFNRLVLPCPVCLHAPFTSVYVHAYVCERVWLIFYWLHAKSNSHRPLMGLKYPLLALTSILRTGCHLSVNETFSRGPSSDSFWRGNPPQNRSEACVLYDYWEFNWYWLSVKLEISWITFLLWNPPTPFTAACQNQAWWPRGKTDICF